MDTTLHRQGPGPLYRDVESRRVPFGRDFRRCIPGALDTLLLWQERATQRWALAQLDARMLKDVGLTRADVDREVRKPFWRG